MVHYNNSSFIREPGKYYTYVDDYLYDDFEKLRLIRRKLKIGLKRAETALDRWLEGKEIRAKRIWFQMFGNMFPAPLPLATGGKLVPPKPLQLRCLVPPKPPPLIRQNALSTLHDAYKKRSTNVLARPLSEQPEHTRNALLGLLAGTKKTFPWDK